MLRVGVGESPSPDTHRSDIIKRVGFSEDKGDRCTWSRAGFSLAAPKRERLGPLGGVFTVIQEGRRSGGEGRRAGRGEPAGRRTRRGITAGVPHTKKTERNLEAALAWDSGVRDLFTVETPRYRSSCIRSFVLRQQILTYLQHQRIVQRSYCILSYIENMRALTMRRKKKRSIVYEET